MIRRCRVEDGGAVELRASVWLTAPECHLISVACKGFAVAMGPGVEVAGIAAAAVELSRRFGELGSAVVRAELPAAPLHGRIECPKLATGFRQTLRLTREQWAAVARCACAGWWGDASGAPSRRAASVEVEASRPAAPAGRGGSTAADAERRHVQASARIEKR